jgi:hypothetical protein
MNNIKQAIMSSLDKRGDPKKAKEIMKYMKNILPFRGI